MAGEVKFSVVYGEQSARPLRDAAVKSHRQESGAISLDRAACQLNL
jgi:hypothetical protein